MSFDDIHIYKRRTARSQNRHPGIPPL